MTTNNLLALVLKIFGLVLVWYAIEPMTYLFGFVLNCVFAGHCPFSVVVLSVAQIFVYLVISFLLICKTDILIQKFRLSKGFDRSALQMNLQPASLLSIGILVFAGLMIIFSIPVILRTAANVYLGSEFYEERTEIVYFIMYSGKLITGLLLILYHKRIVHLMERKRISAEENVQDDAV